MPISCGFILANICSLFSLPGGCRSPALGQPWLGSMSLVVPGPRGRNTQCLECGVLVVEATGRESAEEALKSSSAKWNPCNPAHWCWALLQALRYMLFLLLYRGGNRGQPLKSHGQDHKPGSTWAAASRLSIMVFTVMVCLADEPGQPQGTKRSLWCASANI